MMNVAMDIVVDSVSVATFKTLRKGIFISISEAIKEHLVRKYLEPLVPQR
jgi:hypothetical protein